MKIFLTTIFLFSLLFANDSEIKDIINNIDKVKEIQKIKKENKKEVNYDPFNSFKEAVNKEDKTVSKKRIKNKKILYKKEISVKAIFGKSAFIGNRWYRVGEKFQGFVIYEITSNAIKLKRGKKIKTLTLKKIKRFLMVKAPNKGQTK